MNPAQKDSPIGTPHPDSAAAAFEAGTSLEALGRWAEAEESYRRAIRLRPHFAEALNNLGSVLLRLDQPTKALEALDAALAAAPNFPAARFNKAAACRALRRLPEAEVELQSVLKVHPGHPAALNELGRVLLAQLRAGEAAEVFRDGHRQHPDDPRFLVNLARALEISHDLDGAEEAAQKALALEPGSPALLFTLATLERRRGKLAAARGRLDSMLSAKLSDEDRAAALMELGQILDELGEPRAAFRAITKGNVLLARSPAVQRVVGEGFMDRVRTNRLWFTRERLYELSRRAPATSRPAPVFLVGFPRSGTTLMERVLEAHPQIRTTDERSPLTYLRTRYLESGAYPRHLMHLTAPQVQDLQDRFWKDAERRLGPLEGRLLVDKAPFNIVNLGLVSCLFPNAKVVVALRDPRDVCLSCFMQRFQATEALVHFHDLGRTAAAYAGVMDLWFHFRDTLNLSWQEFRYEDLIDDFEGVVRAILSFIGVEWHPDMAGYRTRATTQVITTPSYHQVTRRLYRTAAGRWRRYREELAPILPTLQPFVEAFGYPAD